MPKKQQITKRLHIECLHHYENETYFNGTDEKGNEFELVVDSLELLEFTDVDELKQSLINFIKKL
tara:strand:- start:444 stop:638 length:195 start_codon:yes stop_codon:yes gene_type:complete